MVKGLSEESSRRIEAARPFSSPAELMRRTGLHTRELRFLARAGALKSLAGHRYQAHWEVATLHPPTELQRIAESTAEYGTEKNDSRIALEAPNAPEADRTEGVARVGDEIVFFLDGVEGARRTITERGEIVLLAVDANAPVCGNPISGGAPTASDALFVLRVAVGLSACTPACQCDVDTSGGTTATDALAVLNAAVGLDVTLDCGSCSASP